MARIIFGVFLLAHSVIHLGWLSPKPDDPKYPFAFKSPWFPNVADAILRAVAPALVPRLCQPSCLPSSVAST